jgi:hypothetical protein
MYLRRMVLYYYYVIGMSDKTLLWLAIINTFWTMVAGIVALLYLWK